MLDSVGVVSSPRNLGRVAAWREARCCTLTELLSLLRDARYVSTSGRGSPDFFDVFDARIEESKSYKILLLLCFPSFCHIMNPTETRGSCNVVCLSVAM